MSNDEVVKIPKALLKSTIDFIDAYDHKLAREVSIRLELPPDLVV